MSTDMGVIGTLHGVQYIERHVRWLELQEILFNLAVMHHKRIWGEPHVDMFHLKKPIMPNGISNRIYDWRNRE